MVGQTNRQPSIVGDTLDDCSQTSLLEFRRVILFDGCAGIGSHRITLFGWTREKLIDPMSELMQMDSGHDNSVFIAGQYLTDRTSVGRDHRHPNRHRLQQAIG